MNVADTPLNEAERDAAEGRPILEIEGLEQRLRDRERPEEFVVYVRQRITIRAGDFVALLGPSGCGKTTLLSVLGLLRAPSYPRALARFSIWGQERGRETLFDVRQAWLGNRQRRIERLRRRHLGFALQSGELLPALTVRENIALPLQLNGVSGRRCRERVEELLDAFGLRKSAPVASDAPRRNTDISAARTNKLSGGEYQRVSLARAIAHRPRLVFIDEPTAALNRELARGALRQFRDLQQDAAVGGATIMITHDETLATEFANLIIRMAPLVGRAAGEVIDVARHVNSALDPLLQAVSSTE